MQKIALKSVKSKLYTNQLEKINTINQTVKEDLNLENHELHPNYINQFLIDKDFERSAAKQSTS